MKKENLKSGDVIFWPNYSAYALLIELEFWKKMYEKENGKPYDGSFVGIPIMILGFLSEREEQSMLAMTPGPKVSIGKAFWFVNQADIVCAGEVINVAKECKRGMPFVGCLEKSYLEWVSTELITLEKYLQGSENIERGESAILGFFRKAIPKRASNPEYMPKDVLPGVR